MAGRGGPLVLPGSNFEVVNSGRIITDGDLAIGVALGFGGDGFNNAVDGQIVNSRVIETVGDGAAGVVMIGDGHHLTNSGRITTDGGTFLGPPVELRAAGVLVSGDDALVENTKKGVIESLDAGSAAVELNVLVRAGLSNADTSSILENFGRIEGVGDAVLGGAGEETVINHGRIVGDVDLGAGHDTFVFAKGGTLTGDLVLGGGDDEVVVENGSGTTNIANFAAGASSNDVIDLSAFFSNFAELDAANDLTGTDVVIALDNNDTLVLTNLQGALNAGDFFFL
jgi:hypothetical protein